MDLDSICIIILFGLLVFAGWAIFRSPDSSSLPRIKGNEKSFASPQDYWLSRVRPLGAARISVPYERTFSIEEADKLRTGVWPEDMDDKWVIYLSESSLDCWRSWSGDCFFSLPARHSGAGTTVGPLVINTDPKGFTPHNEKEVKMLVDLFEQLVNGILTDIGKTAEQSLIVARFNLGLYYSEGRTVTKDYVEAYKWFRLAAEQGYEPARQAIANLEGSLTREQLSEGQKRVKAFRQPEDLPLG